MTRTSELTLFITCQARHAISLLFFLLYSHISFLSQVPWIKYDHVRGNPIPPTAPRNLISDVTFSASHVPTNISLLSLSQNHRQATLKGVLAWVASTNPTPCIVMPHLAVDCMWRSTRAPLLDPFAFLSGRTQR
ncbi:hypothetical protein IWZ03DRAFT_383377 [Phyllosticta citriasiana]|uniref:Uncharacterized protein n=1 Tax=Phyllosticta citriasiana TaxID=595635 RepID=A0ABR1KGP0_9PEZI